MYKKIALTFLFLLLLILLAFKPLSKIVAEIYLSSELNAEVSINNYRLFPLNADLFVATVKLGEQEVKDLKTNLKFSGMTLKTLSSFENKQLQTKELSFDYNISNGNFEGNTDLEIVGFDTVHLQTQGSYKDENLSADINGKFAKNGEFDFVVKLNKDGNSTRAELKTNSFGGDLQASFIDDKLTLVAKSLQLKRIFKQLKQEQIVKGDVNVEATLDVTTLKSKLSLSSKELVAYEQSFQNVNFDIEEFVYKTKNLNLIYKLNFEKNEKSLSVNGDVHYANKLRITANTQEFGGKSAFVLDDKKINLKLSSISTQELLSFLGQKAYLSGAFDLTAKGDLKNINIELDAPQLTISKEMMSREENLTLKLSANYTPTHVSFSPYLKTSMIELVTGSGIYDIEKKRVELKQNLHLTYEKIDAPMYVEATYEDEVLKAQTASFGGETKIVFKDNKLNAKLDTLSIKTLDKMFLQEDILQKGALSGGLVYDLKHKSGKTELRVENAIVSGVDLDAKLGTLMNAVGLNIFSLKNELFDNNKTLETKITHLEFDATLEDENIHLLDSAFSTKKFRIAALGDFKQSGEIQKLDVYLLDKNGCSIIKQKISGTLLKPELDNKILTTTDVVISIPGELLNHPKRLLDFSTQTVDKTASFLLNLTHLSDANVTLVSDVSDGAFNLVDDTSKIVLKECRVVYDGKVKAINKKR